MQIGHYIEIYTRICLTFQTPLLAMKHLRAIRNASVSMAVRTSMCTARVVMHLKRMPHLDGQSSLEKDQNSQHRSRMVLAKGAAVQEEGQPFLALPAVLSTFSIRCTGIDAGEWPLDHGVPSTVSVPQRRLFLSPDDEVSHRSLE